MRVDGSDILFKISAFIYTLIRTQTECVPHTVYYLP